MAGTELFKDQAVIQIGGRRLVGDHGDLDACLPLGVQKLARQVVDLRVSQGPDQQVPLVRVRVPERLRIAQGHQAAFRTQQGDCFQDVARSVLEGRIHDDQGIALLGAVGQEVVMDHPQALVLQDRAEVRVDLDAVQVRDLGLAVVTDGQAPFLDHRQRQVAFAGAGLEHAVRIQEIDILKHLPDKGRRSRPKAALRFLAGNKIHQISHFGSSFQASRAATLR